MMWTSKPPTQPGTYIWLQSPMGMAQKVKNTQANRTDLKGGQWWDEPIKEHGDRGSWMRIW